MRSLLTLAFLSLATVAAQVPDLAAAAAAGSAIAPDTRYDDAIPTIEQVNGYRWGERISSHAEVERYLRALAEAAPDRVQLVPFGESWQGRTLYYVVVGSADNVARRQDVQRRMQRLADPRGLDDAAADALLDGLPAVGWLANCVHGDEPSGTDAALYVLYHLLAAQGDEIVDKVRRDCLVLIDPLQNPDGRDRFVFYTRGARGRFADPTPTAAEHSQPWPSGRTNHALFDMNRDWFGITQPETAARVRAFLAWWPLVYVDLHEMGGNSTYYFPPPAQPINGEITATQRDWLRRYGKNNARWFDRYGFDYFTREAYDAFYPGYGDSWPMAHGSIGMTFEMASARGLVYRRSDEALLRYRDGVRRHFVASMGTLETLADGRQAAQRAFLEHRRDGVARGQRGTVRSYVFPPEGDRTRLSRLANLMMRQGIEVHEARAELRCSDAAPLGGGAEDGEARTFPAGSFVVSMAQPASTLATMLLQPHFDMDEQFLARQRARQQRRAGAEFYDLTAWSLPLLFGVPCFEARSATSGELRRLEVDAATSGAAPLREQPPKVAYVIPWGSNGAGALLAELLRMRVRVRSIDEPFVLDGQRFGRGSCVVRVKGQPDAAPADLHPRIAELAATHGVSVHCADSSWIEEGPSFGTRRAHTLRAPRIAMAWDRPVDTYSAGWLRYLLEQRYGLPVTALRTRDLTRTDLDRFTVLVLPEGRGYGRELGSSGSKAIQGFVRRGGVLVTLGSATQWLAQKDVGLLATGAESRGEKLAGRREGEGEGDGAEPAGGDDPGGDDPGGADDARGDEAFDYQQAIQPDKERPPRTPGAILRVQIDGDHWLGAGYDGEASVVHDGSHILTPIKLDRGTNVVRYATRDALVRAGFVWPESRDQLPEKAYLVHQPHGRGHVVAFAEDPNVRAFVDGLNLLLLNAVLRTAGR